MIRLGLTLAFFTAPLAHAERPSDDWDRTILVVEALIDFPLDVGDA
jgi:hypothetical protein